MKPARAVHKTAEAVDDLEAQRADCKPTFKDLAKRTINVGDASIFWWGNGEIHSTVTASMRYMADELQLILDYGNSE